MWAMGRITCHLYYREIEKANERVQEYGFTTNFKDEVNPAMIYLSTSLHHTSVTAVMIATNSFSQGGCPKSTPETVSTLYNNLCVCLCVTVCLAQSTSRLITISIQYCQSKGMLVQPSDVNKTETARKLVLFTSSEECRTHLRTSNADERSNIGRYHCTTIAAT